MRSHPRVNSVRRIQDWHWSKVTAVTTPCDVPVFADCARYGGNPFDLASDRPESLPAPTRDWNKTNPMRWEYDMARFCLDRHSRAIQATCADGSARLVQLGGLWDLQWHQAFQRYQPRPAAVVSAALRDHPTTDLGAVGVEAKDAVAFRREAGKFLLELGGGEFDFCNGDVSGWFSDGGGEGNWALAMARLPDRLSLACAEFDRAIEGGCR